MIIELITGVAIFAVALMSALLIVIAGIFFTALIFDVLI